MWIVPDVDGASAVAVALVAAIPGCYLALRVRGLRFAGATTAVMTALYLPAFLVGFTFQSLEAVIATVVCAPMLARWLLVRSI